MNWKIFGKNRDRMPSGAFRMMSLLFAVRDRLTSPWSVLDRFDIEPGQAVIDYGCGPGSYLRHASELVGPEGRVFAVDIHTLAIKTVLRRIEKQRLSNVTAVLANEKGCSLPDDVADVIYALDMFHMVSEPALFLRELHRMCKPTGLLYIDSGHQSREEARAKVRSSGVWEIREENKRYLKCTPVPKNDLRRQDSSGHQIHV